MGLKVEYETRVINFFSLQMKDVPKLGGPDSLFYRAGVAPGVTGLTPGYTPRLPLTSPHQYPAGGQHTAAAAPAGQPAAQHQTKVKYQTINGIIVLKTFLLFVQSNDYFSYFICVFRKLENGMQCT